MKLNKYKNEYGFSLLEVLIAIAIISIGLIGISSLSVQNIKAQSVNKNRLIASMLAQEGLELVRNVRDDNWLDESEPNWFDYIFEDSGNDGALELEKTFIIHAVNSQATHPWLLDDEPDDFTHPDTYLYVDSGTGFFTHISTGNIRTLFKRLVKVRIFNIPGTDALEDVMRLQVEVRWMERNNTQTYTAETYLYNWR